MPLCGLLIGTAAAIFYYRRGLTLSHYDAKAHLVVARRVLDSLTPEYSQIGAVWLPLPHLLNLLPVQIDAFYRTGASAVAISIASFALACYAIAHLVLRVTGSRAAAAISRRAVCPQSRRALSAIDADDRAAVVRAGPAVDQPRLRLGGGDREAAFTAPSIVAQRRRARKRDGVLSSRA